MNLKTLMIGCWVAAVCALPLCAEATQLNVATVTCSKYENEIIAPAAPGSANASFDPINTMMWLFGFAVGKSGAHVMYGDALAAFGFSLDAQCKDNPNQSLQDAVTSVKPDNKNPMDLTSLDCATFASRHAESVRNDAQSARTIMMWLFGFAVAKAGGHVLDSDALDKFEPAFFQQCSQHPQQSVFDALGAVRY